MTKQCVLCSLCSTNCIFWAKVANLKRWRPQIKCGERIHFRYSPSQLALTILLHNPMPIMLMHLNYSNHTDMCSQWQKKTMHCQNGCQKKKTAHPCINEHWPVVLAAAMTKDNGVTGWPSNMKEEQQTVSCCQLLRHHNSKDTGA